MGAMKEMWIAAHMELVEEYLEAHPDVSWDEAYEITADRADDRFRDNFADAVDAARVRAKEAKL